MGSIIVLASTFLFAAATVAAKHAAQDFGVGAPWVTMSRFVVGLLLCLPAVIAQPGVLRPREPRWVILRAATNVVAVLLFFFGIQYTAVSKANLLNMTYPVFVFLFAPFVTGERTSRRLYLFLAMTLLGVWNIVRPDQLDVVGDGTVGDALAFASAVVAGFAISALRRARRNDGSTTIVVYVMALGVVLNAGLLPFVPMPRGIALVWALGAGALGAVGQFALTAGFRFVSAPAGALLSTARIPIAGVAGVVLFAEPFGLRTAVGSALILVSLVGATITGQPRRR